MRAPRSTALLPVAALATALAAASCSAGAGSSGDPCTTSAECVPDPGGRAECRQGGCVTVYSCGQELPCLDAGQLCDPKADACYPASGACTTVASCPNLRAALAGPLTCDAGFCRLGAPALALVPGLDGAGLVTVTSPLPGESLAASADLEVRWSQPPGGDPALVYVLDAQPTSKEAVAASAIWGAAVRAGDARVARFSSGHSIAADGTWKAPVAFPAGVPLYAIVLAVRNDALVGSSAPVPFSVGAAWLGRGAVCTAPAGALVIPGACYDPARLQTCQAGACAVLCASHLDCADFGLRCGALVDGVRTCE